MKKLIGLVILVVIAIAAWYIYQSQPKQDIKAKSDSNVVGKVGSAFAKGVGTIFGIK